MAQNINSVVLTGNLTKDPELRHTPGGTVIAAMRLAVNERFKDQSGDWKDRANYFDVTVFGRTAESCAQYLAKGRPIAVQGRLRWREWQADDGTKRQAVEIVADRVQFLASRGDGDSGYGGGSGGGNDFVPAGSVEGGGGNDFSPSAADDDIPF